MKFFFIYQIILNIFFVFYFEKISKILNLFDLPDNERKLHKKKTPSIGGCLIFINIFSFFFYHLVKNIFFDLNFDLDFFDRQEFVIFILFSFSFFFIGILDDKIYLNANIKLALYFFFIILILALLNDKILINFINFTFVFYNSNDLFISIFFTLICFLLFINAFNMYDGINLQSGLYSIFIFSIFLYKGIFTEISITLITSLFFFLYLNWRNKCFLGNNGALLLSFVISYLFIKSNSVNTFYADEIFLIMMIPGIDLLRLAIFRLAKGKHPFSADRNHLHHLLLNNFGFNKTIVILNLMTTIPYFIFIFFGHIIYLIIFSFLTYAYLIFKYSYKNLN